MEIVNKYFLDDILSPLVGGADFDELQYLLNLDADNVMQGKELIKVYLFPYFQSTTQSYMAKCKLSLAYFLKQNKIDFERIVDSNLLPIAAPSTPINFFIWIWEVFFPNDFFLDISTENCIERNDQYEPIRLNIKPKT